MSTHETQAMPPVPEPTAPASDGPARRRRWQLIGVVVAAVALLVGVFVIGRATGSTTQSGPTSLGAARPRPDPGRCRAVRRVTCRPGPWLGCATGR